MEERELPAGWEWKKLGNIGKIYSGSTPSTSDPENFNGEIPWITPADLSRFNDIYIKRGKRNISKNGLSSSSIQILPVNTVLFSSRAPVGYVALAANPLTTNQGFKNLVLTEGYDPKYIYYFLRSHKSEIERFASGTTFLEISAARFAKIRILIPPLPVQRQIAAILEQIESVRRLRSESDSLTQQLLQSVFFRFFGDPVRNEKGWPIKGIQELAANSRNAIKAGPFGSSLKKEYYTEIGYRIYGQEQVIRDDLKYGDYYISQERYEQLIQYRVQAGDVLISLVGSYGKISIVPEGFEPGIINPRLMKITLDKEIVSPVYFKYLMQSREIISQLQNLSHGGTMDIINVGILKQLKIPVPPLELQEQFSIVVEQVNELRRLQGGSNRDIESLANTLTSKAFVGELVH